MVDLLLINQLRQCVLGQVGFAVSLQAHKKNCAITRRYTVCINIRVRGRLSGACGTRYKSMWSRPGRSVPWLGHAHNITKHTAFDPDGTAALE